MGAGSPGGDPKPVGPDALPATEHHPISPDGAWIALANPAGGIRLLATNAGADKDLAGAEPETPLAFTGDGSAVFVLRRGPTWTIHRLVIASGERTLWSEITPPESRVAAMRIDEAGEHFVYSTINMVSADLYLLEPPEPAK